MSACELSAWEDICIIPCAHHPLITLQAAMVWHLTARLKRPRTITNKMSHNNECSRSCRRWGMLTAEDALPLAHAPAVLSACCTSTAACWSHMAPATYGSAAAAAALLLLLLLLLPAS